MRILALLAILSLGCNKAPPASQLPDGQAAIDRMRSSYSCVAGIQVNDGKADGFAEQRVRTDIMMMAVMPDRFRLDVTAPVVGNVAILTSNGQTFALTNLRTNQFVTGPALPCNVAQFTSVDIPIHALVDLVTGRAPILVHDAAPTVKWDGSGYYVVTVVGKNDAVEEFHLVPRESDWAKPWQEQRFRVLHVRVVQQGTLLYEADLKDHQIAEMGVSPVLSPADMMLGLSPDPPSGPVCTDAEIPRSIHVEVPWKSSDLILRFNKVIVNPAIDVSTAFNQAPRAGLVPVTSTCSSTP